MTPSCTSNNAGIREHRSVVERLGTGTNITNVRCELTGAPCMWIHGRSEFVAFADQPHFNLAAFRMLQPNGSIGNLGDTPVGILRHPSWHQFDLTLSRRFPLTRRPQEQRHHDPPRGA